MAGEVPDGIGPMADELYQVDPADFVAARNELVRRLRAEKHREEAAAVAKLRRPTPAAWALNRLARDHRSELEALVALGDDLRAAQVRALDGAGGAELRRAAQARRDAVAGLTGAAARLLAERGGGVDAHLPGVTATLDAASLGAGAGAGVLTGRLSAELDPPSGFGGPAPDLPDRPAPAPAPAPGAGPAAGPEEGPEPAPDPAAVKELADAEAAVADATRQAAEMAAAARASAATAGQRRRAVEEAEAAVATQRARLEEAEGALAAAMLEADEGQRLALEADTAAADAAGRLDDAESRLRRARG